MKRDVKIRVMDKCPVLAMKPYIATVESIEYKRDGEIDHIHIMHDCVVRPGEFEFLSETDREFFSTYTKAMRVESKVTVEISETLCVI